MRRRGRTVDAPAKPVGGAFPQRHPAYQRIYAVVSGIPRGRVATYGQVALAAGLPGHARQAGYALNALPPGARVPWQRVINSQGRISPRAEPGAEDLQRALLEAEGVAFDERGKVDFRRFGWLAPALRVRSARSRRGGRRRPA
jgi:methylated-DNA-protein-cysteine methyltransferase-like protein